MKIFFFRNRVPYESVSEPYTDGFNKTVFLARNMVDGTIKVVTVGEIMNEPADTDRDLFLRKANV